MLWLKKVKCFFGKHEYGSVFYQGAVLSRSCPWCHKLSEVTFDEKVFEEGVLSGSLEPYFKTVLNRFNPTSATDKKIKRELERVIWETLWPVACKLPDTKEGFDILWNQNHYHVCSSKFKHRVQNTASMMVTDYVLIPYGRDKKWLKS